jgi:hypothetical protein
MSNSTKPTMKAKNREYLSLVSLMFLSHDLDPDFITNNLGLKPDRQWKKGDRQESNAPHCKSKHKKSGWIKVIPKKFEGTCLEDQLTYWHSKLHKQKDKLQLFKEKGYYRCLDCFVTTDETASILFNETLLKKIAGIGIEIRLRYWNNKNHNCGG